MNKNSQSGYILISILGIVVVLSFILTAVSSSALNNFGIANRESFRMNAQFAADAGLDIAIAEINEDESWVGTAGQGVGGVNEIVLLDDTINDVRTTYEIIITDVSTEEKIARSIGRTYSPASNTTPEASREFELELSAVTSGTGPGSVVSGVGGLIVNNNAKITGGDVIVNGSVAISNNGQIGLSTNPINLRVAHQSCPDPADATFPQVCTSGEPITNNGLIYGDVHAQNQTTNTGMSDPGLTSDSFAPVPVPGYDRTAHKAAVTNSYPSTSSNVRCGNNQTQTWPANTQITGDITLGNRCTVIIEGDVWITGSLSFGNRSNIVVAEALNSTRPVIMIDDEDGFVSGNNTTIQPNSFGSGIEIITTWWNTNTSTNGGFDCGGISDPLDCTNVTGLALSTSQNTTTIDLANGTNAESTVFRTLWSRAEISNNGALGAVAGQTIELRQNAVINFTAAIPGSDNLVTTWVKRGYLRVFQ